MADPSALSKALGAGPSASLPVSEPSESSVPEDMGEEEAAKALISAIRAGDPEEVVMAYKELKRACDYSSEVPDEEL